MVVFVLINMDTKLNNKLWSMPMIPTQMSLSFDWFRTDQMI